MSLDISPNTWRAIAVVFTVLAAIINGDTSPKTLGEFALAIAALLAIIRASAKHEADANHQ